MAMLVDIVKSSYMNNLSNITSFYTFDIKKFVIGLEKRKASCCEDLCC